MCIAMFLKDTRKVFFVCNEWNINWKWNLIIIRPIGDHFVLSGQDSSDFIVFCFVLNFSILKVRKGIIDDIILEMKFNRHDFLLLLLFPFRNQNCKSKLLM